MGFDAVILAGGRSSRLGGTSKAGLVRDGKTLLEHAIAAVREHTRRIVVVGDRPADGRIAADVQFVRESPPFGGPAAAIAAGCALLARSAAAPYVVVLACDMPDVVRALPVLIDTVRSNSATDGVVAVDDDGHMQPLVAIYRMPALREAIDRHSGGVLDGVSANTLIRPLMLTRVTVPRGSTDDIDTWEDASRHSVRAPADEGNSSEQR